MTAMQFPELIVDSIISLIRLNISSKSTAMIADRNTVYGEKEASRVHLDESPVVKFYITETADAFELPACHVIAKNCIYTNEKNQANSVSGDQEIELHFIDSDRTPEMATRKAMRYTGILYSILHLSTITSANSSLWGKISVESSDYSQTYVSKNGNEFSREVMMDLKVQFRQNF